MTATIAYLGFDSPSGSAGISGDAARVAGPGLAQFVNGLRHFNRTASRTVIGHSYGSAVVGAAMANGMQAENVILTGSPGILADNIAETGFGGSVYAAQTSGDAGYFSVSFSMPLCSSLGCSDLNPLGPDPYDFAGVRRLAIGSATGHNAYYRDTSLRSIGAVVDGSVGINPAGFWGVP